jgi:hypothetical protein
MSQEMTEEENNGSKMAKTFPAVSHITHVIKCTHLNKERGFIYTKRSHETTCKIGGLPFIRFYIYPR